MINFSVAPVTGEEIKYITQAIESRLLAGDGHFTHKCESWFEEHLVVKKTLLTTSCTHALEMAAILIGIEPGDEVIMPSFTFVSTANAFVLRGATIVFIDVRPDTMNMDEKLIEAAITPKTKVIVPVHYAGVGCEMDTIMAIAKKYDLFVVEDAAQGMMASYDEKPLGTIGHLGAYSFHNTKNYTSGGEGGLLIINDESMIERAEILREKGTNRSQFYRGMVDKYSWVDMGSSYLPSEIQAAYLWAQLLHAKTILQDRMSTWKHYDQFFRSAKLPLELPDIPEKCIHNGHMYFLKTEDFETRQVMIEFLKEAGIFAVFHYVPLHSAPAGRKYGRFHGQDRYTTSESERLARLPFYYQIDTSSLDKICRKVREYFQ